MRTALLTLALLTTSLSPVWAGEISAASKIDAVTVYPQGAEVTRLATVRLPAGETTLLLNGLPQEVDAQSIRVEGAGGQGIEISSVDTRVEPLFTAEQNAARKQMEDSIQSLQDERSALDQTIADADFQKRLLMGLADKQLTPVATPEKPATIDGAGLGSVLEVVSAKLEAISKTIHASQLRQRDIDKQVAELQIRLQNLAPDQGSKLSVAIHLAAAAETEGAFKIKYRVSSAQWMPFYDARLATSDTGKLGKIEIVRRAEVVQNTGEEWKDVSLTLSTARVMGATEAPLLGEDELQVYDPELDGKVRREMGLMGSAENAPAAPASSEALLEKDMAQDAAKPALQLQAVVDVSGFQAQYLVQGRETVDNSGTTKKVRITTDNYEGQLQAFTVPKIDTQAYLTASFKVASEAPLLAGPVNLYRDGIYLGQGSLPQLNEGEDVKLGFGADDLIKVKRKEIKRQIGEEGIISSSNVRVQAWDISVKNLHKFAVPVQVLDHMPFSANEKVTVELLPTTTEPSVKDFEKRRGVFAWNLEMEPQAEKVISFGYKVGWPKEMQLSVRE